tara:strand:- start:1097 stop:1708 length:612 start_codon:yes stop_codon:yes gene_type:complete
MKDSYRVKKISTKESKKFIHQLHYSKGSSNGPSPCYGLFDNEVLIGSLMIANPCSEAVKAQVFGKELKHTIRELHRLAIIDDTPKNTESWFISRCLKLISQDRPDLWAIITFADSTINHKGTIYKATNALYLGKSSAATFYLDGERLRHPRQNGKNITIKEAKMRGWEPVKRQAKYRFLFILGNKREKKERTKMIKMEVLPYV